MKNLTAIGKWKLEREAQAEDMAEENSENEEKLLT